MTTDEKVAMLELTIVGLSQRVEILAKQLSKLQGEVVFGGGPATDAKFYTIADLVILTGISKSTILRMIKLGSFPRGRKLGAQTVYPRDEVADHLATLPPAIDESPFS